MHGTGRRNGGRARGTLRNLYSRCGQGGAVLHAPIESLSRLGHVFYLNFRFLMKPRL